jgi:hypothetical protein
MNDPARHIQFGFETTGVNVWITDVGPYGKIDITTIPEPSIAALAMAGIAGGMMLLRRRSAVRS